jgi:hypothetical protein
MKRVPHVLAVVAYWLVLIGLAGEFGTEQGQQNNLLPWIFLGWIAFGIWRVVRKYHRRRQARAKAYVSPWTDTSNVTKAPERTVHVNPLHNDDEEYVNLLERATLPAKPRKPKSRPVYVNPLRRLGAEDDLDS